MSWFRTCLSDSMTSCVVAVATMALLLPGLSCRDKDSPDTNWTPSSVTVTLSSCTLMLLSARTEDVRGESTCNTRQQLPLMTVHKDPRWHSHSGLRGRENFAGGHCCWQWCHWCLKPALSFVTKRLCGSFFEILSHALWVPVVLVSKQMFSRTYACSFDGMSPCS